MREIAARLGCIVVVLLLWCASAWGQCGAPPNQIVAENCLTGSPSSQWDISGAGDLTIQGFSTDISYNVGQTVGFKINTNAAAYRLDIYRMGYYAGLGARKVATVNPSATLPQTQPACLTDAATHLYDCGNWAISATWTIPANAVSGIYFALLTRTDTGGTSHIVFIVRNDASTSAMLFQTSDTTWQAYNSYGGHSLYGTNNTFDLPNRALKVSYNRPNTVRGWDSITWLFDAEYPMVRWLEANGYDVTYFTGMDASRSGQLIKNHKIYLSVGHDEYWSGPQRTNVEAARAAGVSLAFFSGNEIFWKTRWENSIDGSNTANRTLVCYKETMDNAKTDPTGTWTGTWRDPRFSPPADGGQPENGLSGTIFMVNGTDNRSLQVPAEDGKMRFWRNTSVATQSPGGTVVFPSGTVGFEWDEDLDNGARPAGLIHLSTSPPYTTGNLLLDYGGTYGNGTATHNLTMYRTGGALVFAAGTVRWSWGLDATHDNSSSPVVPADVRMQQATVNLFADMGTQPGSIQPGLFLSTQSTDTSSPVSSITSPSPGFTVSAGTPVTISGTASDFGGGVVGGVEVSTDSGATWHPATGRATWTYTYTPTMAGTFSIQSRATDDSLNIQNSVASVSITVTGGFATTWSPAATPATVDGHDGTAVELGMKFRSDIAGTVTGVRFYKATTNTGTHIGNLWSSTGTLLGTVTFTAESASGWQQANFAAPIQIAANTTYIISYFAPVGHYSLSADFFALSVDNPPLHALADGTDGPNGVYRYGTTSGFPTQTFNSSNYWVDLAFSTSVPPVISGLNAATTATSATITWSTNVSSTSRVDYGTSPTSLITLVANSSLVTAHSLTLTGLTTSTTYYYRVTSVDSFGNSATSPVTTGPPGSFVPAMAPPVISAVTATPGATSASITWSTDTNSSSRVDYGTSATSLTLNASNPTLVTGHSINLSGLAATTTYFYRVTSVDGSANSSTSPVTTGPPASFTTVDTTPPVITNVTATPGLGGSAVLSWTTNKPSDSRVDYGTSSGSLTLNVTNATMVTAHTLTLSGLTQGATYFYRVTSVDGSGNSVTSPVAPGTAAFVENVMSVWSPSVTPGTVDGGDGVAVELGMKFRSDTAGAVLGVRFYKATTNTGTHVGHVWSSTGTLLGSVTFSGESASGWQQANFTTPIQIAANTSYVISYFAPVGHYSFNGGFFTTVGVDNAPLHALRNGLDGPNALYLYTATGAFPTQTYNSSNYWVDVVFSANTAPVISGVNAATTATSATITWSTDTASNSRVDYGTSPTSLTVNASNPSLVTAHSLTLTGLSTGTTYYYRVTSADSLGNSTTSPVTTNAPATFTAVVPPPVISAVAATPGSTTASITWTTDTNSSSRVDYGTSATSLTLNASDATLVTSHGINLSGLASNTTYFFRVISVDGSGNGSTSPATTGSAASFTTVDTTPPVITNVTATPGLGGSAVLSWTTNKPATSRVDYGTSSGSLTLNVTNAAMVTAHSVTLSGLTQGSTYFYRVTSVDGLGESVSSPVAPATSSFVENVISVWSASVTPGTVDGGDGTAVELGMKFRSDVAGFVRGVRFYKATTNTGTHVGKLWSSTGTLLGSVTFTGESASGWQQANFASPIQIAANTTYIISYFAPVGHYSFNGAFFSTVGVDNAPLHALRNGLDGLNAVYLYTNTGAFPTQSFNSSNYWVDVVFGQ